LPTCEKTGNALVIVPVADALPGPVSLTTDRPAVIGRATDCRIVLTAAPVSKRHAELSWSGTAWCVKDLHSSNGTWLNDWRIEPDLSVIVHHGDLLRFGSCELEVHLHSESQDQVTPGSGTYATRASLLQRLHGPASIERDLVWEDFRKRYAPVIVGFSRHAGLRAQDAEDVLQDVMLGFFRVASTFEYDRQKGHFRAYLKRATLNAIRGRVRRAGNVKVVSDELLDAQVETSETHWEGHWAEQILERALDEARRRFDEQTFEAFELYGRRGVPVDEAARTLGMSRESVYQAKTRVMRVVQAIVEQLRASEG
jgi:RNA polymerase sigma-70 factor (ECF subfamily)